jgi:hypothetical protein
MTASSTSEALASIDAGQVVHNGRLILKGSVRASINEKRLVPVMLKAILEAFPEEGLNFLDVVSTSNGGDFPLERLARALGKELKPYQGRISSSGRQICLEGDRLLNYERYHSKRS